MKRLSLLFFALAGFFALPDLINVLSGQPTAPCQLYLVNKGLFYYGSKKELFKEFESFQTKDHLIFL